MEECGLPQVMEILSRSLMGLVLLEKCLFVDSSGHRPGICRQNQSANAFLDYSAVAGFFCNVCDMLMMTKAVWKKRCSLCSPVTFACWWDNLDAGWWGRKFGDEKPDRGRELSSIGEPRTERSRKTWGAFFVPTLFLIDKPY